ncbi:MAG TPA: hypothetical protein VHD32_07915 [Candidatus Didemnitutus sp.]|nr:hypothetical protein [Candidatus Didemnitutus sp.]
MNRSTRTIIAAAALAGLYAGSFALKATASVSNSAGISASHDDQGKSSCTGKDGCKAHDCKGKNDCKGKGGCQSGDNGCKGKNSCKGKGGCSSKDDKKLV